MIGRQISLQDERILQIMLDHDDNVKIDFDIMNEPCIFYEYKGEWDIVYKLSKDGTYTQHPWYYAVQAHRAIINYLIQQKKKTKETDERLYQENFYKKRAQLRSNYEQ